MTASLFLAGVSFEQPNAQIRPTGRLPRPTGFRMARCRIQAAMGLPSALGHGIFREGDRLDDPLALRPFEEHAEDPYLSLPPSPRLRGPTPPGSACNHPVHQERGQGPRRALALLGATGECPALHWRGRNARGGLPRLELKLALTDSYCEGNMPCAPGACTCYEGMGMFDELLAETEARLGLAPFPHETDEWKEKARDLVYWLVSDMESLVATAEAVFSEKITRHSVVEANLNSHPFIEVGAVRLRPNRRYYESRGAPLPVPEDPRGPHATGLKIELSLCGGHEHVSGPLPARILLTFQVWGDDEREAFKEFYSDHRWMVGQLTRDLDLAFETACVFDSVDRYTGRNVARMLQLYFSEHDEESNFSLVATLTKGAERRRVIRAFLVFTALYDGCYHYVCRRGRRDTFIQHYHRLK